MPRPPASRLPSAVTDARQRFNAWRKSHRPKSRIPDDLWREAAKLASVYGLYRIARALRLDYYSLRKHLAPKTAAASAPSFVELAISPPREVPPHSPFVVEVQRPDGTRMTIHLPGSSELVAVVRSFWSRTA